MNTPTEEQIWQFPCTMPIKIMGPASNTLEPLATKIIQNHIPDYNGHNTKSTPSKTGKYISLTAEVIFQNKQQVDALFAELSHYQQNTDDISFVI